MTVKESVQLRGVHIPGSRIDVEIIQVGPGIVHLQFSTPFGKVMLIQTVTPIQPLLQAVGHQVFAGNLVQYLVLTVLVGIAYDKPQSGLSRASSRNL